MRISVLQHAPSEGPGEIQNWAVDRGHSVKIHHLYRGAALPALDTLDFLVIMGGEMNIYQDRDFPWLKPERQFIQAALQAGKPAVGICLGAQFIADALGQRVTQNSLFEIGWFPLRSTREAQDIFPSIPAEIMALHWHGDTFSLPPSATRLGSSEACLEQGFVIPGRCLALQFHFETNAPLVKSMVEESSDFSQWPKGRYVQSPAMILEGAELHCPKTQPVLFHLLDTFYASCPAPITPPA